MWSSHSAVDSDACPVGEEMLGSLYRASEHGLPVLVESVSADVRAMLALYCYRRAHLHSMSLAIAATCSERDLVEQGGIAGSTLFAMSREAPASRCIATTTSVRTGFGSQRVRFALVRRAGPRRTASDSDIGRCCTMNRPGIPGGQLV